MNNCYTNEYIGIKFTEAEIKLLKRLGNICNQFPINCSNYILIPKHRLVNKIRKEIRGNIKFNGILINRYIKIIMKLTKDE